MRMRYLMLGVIAAILAVSTSVSAQNKNPRFGKWKLKQDQGLNIMTYEPLGDKGMKVTIESTNAKGEMTKWGYDTMFDGKDMPVVGQGPGRTSAVRVIDGQVNEVINKTDGKVTQILYNILAQDQNSIGVMYYRDDGAGKTTNITFAMYERMP